MSQIWHHSRWCCLWFSTTVIPKNLIKWLLESYKLEQHFVNCFWKYTLPPNDSTWHLPQGTGPLDTLHRYIPTTRHLVTLRWVLLRMMSWLGHAFCITGPLLRESTGHQWIPLTQGQWCGALMLLALTSCWTNIEDVCALRCHGAYVMLLHQCWYHLILPIPYRVSSLAL